MKYSSCNRRLVLWITLAFVILVESERPKFRDDYRFEKGFNAFYKVHHTAASWLVARMRCESEGAELMVPECLDEADAMPLLISTILRDYNEVFIGIHDMYAERLFVTIDGSSMIGSILNLLWETKEPKHGAGRCLTMHHNGQLSVKPCEHPLPFICKVKTANIAYYKECDSFDSRWKLGPNGTCYLLHVEPQSWYNAYGTCLAAGGQLSVMSSREEAKHVRGLFKQITERRLPDTDFLFLGFNDLFQRYHYRTIKGQRIDVSGYADWTLRCAQQDNRTCDRDRCGGLRRSGLLALADCDVPAMFLCEKTTDYTKSVPETKKQAKKSKADVRVGTFRIQSTSLKSMEDPSPVRSVTSPGADEMEPVLKGNNVLATTRTAPTNDTLLRPYLLTQITKNIWPFEYT